MRYFGAFTKPRQTADLPYLLEQAATLRLEAYRPSQLRWAESVFAGRLLKAAKSDIVFEILMEEWEFLTSESWVVSRLRRPFATFLKAGGVAVEWGGRAFDAVAAKTLKIPESEIPRGLTPNQRLRAASKWIAVGGSSFASYANPNWAALLTGATGLFFLFDP